MSEDFNPDLLKTIRLPNNLHYLTDKLPRANYSPINVDEAMYASGHKNTMPDLHKKNDGSVISTDLRQGLGSKKLALINQRRPNRPKIGRKLPDLKPKPLGRTPKLRADLKRNEMINRQHDKLEAQIKRYNEILKNHKQYRQQSALKKQIEKIIKKGPNPVNNEISMQIHGKAIRSPHYYKSVPKKPRKLAAINQKLPKVHSNNIIKKRPGAYGNSNKYRGILN